MASAKKCKCGRKLILEMDKVRGRCFECVRERTRPRKRGGLETAFPDEPVGFRIVEVRE